MAAELTNFFGDKMCATTIPRNVKLAEAPSYGKPALLYDLRSRGAEAYLRLAKELMKRGMSSELRVASPEPPAVHTEPAAANAEQDVAAVNAEVGKG